MSAFICNFLPLPATSLQVYKCMQYHDCILKDALIITNRKPKKSTLEELHVIRLEHQGKESRNLNLRSTEYLSRAKE